MPKSDDVWLSEFSPRMRGHLQAKLDSIRARSAAVTAFRANRKVRAERWAIQAELRAALR